MRALGGDIAGGGEVILSATVAEAIASRFPEAVRKQAQNALPKPESLTGSAPYERVLLALISLSEGDLDRLRHLAGVATTDWRDVLYWHEHPHGGDEPRTWEELRARLKLPEAETDKQ